MNGNENKIEPLKHVAAKQRIADQQAIKTEPSVKCSTRNRLPVFFERVQKRKPLAECRGNFHRRLILPAVCRHRSKGRIDSSSSSHAFRYCVHHFPAAI